MSDKYRRMLLRLKSLTFISLVDNPAQEPALVALIKSAGDESEITATARIVKVADELGLVFGWAMVTSIDGVPYQDLQHDVISEEEMVAAAADFMASGQPSSDVMHDGVPQGRVLFAWPMVPDVAAAMGVKTSTYGLMIAVKPEPAILARVKSGELRAFSIGATGYRQPIDKRADAAPTGQRSAAADEKRAADIRKTAEIKAWFDALPIEKRAELARTYGPTEWNAGFTQSQECHMAIEKLDAVEKAARIESEIQAVRKRAVDAEHAARARLNARAAFVAKRDKINMTIARVRAMELDPEGRAAYVEIVKAREAQREARVTAYKSIANARLEQARAKWDALVEDHVLKFNVTRGEAADRLLAISKTAQALRADLEAAKDDARGAEQRALRDDEQARRSRAEQAQRERQAALEAARDAKRTPSERALEKRAAEIMAERGLTHAEAMAHAIQHDPVGIALRRVVEAERLARR